MQVIIKNCDEFYNTFKYVESLASEVKVLCQPEEVWLQVHNPSCTAIAEVKFPADYFEEYTCEKPVQVGINTKIFLQILKNTYKKKSVTLKMAASEDEDKMHISITIDGDETSGNVQCSYEMKLVDITSDFMNIPDQHVHSKYKLSVETLKKWKQFLFSDCAYLTFTPEEAALKIQSENDLKDRLTLTDEISPLTWHESAEVTDEETGVTSTIKRKWKAISIGSVNAKYIFDLMIFSRDVTCQFFIVDAPVEYFVKLDEGVHIRVFIAPKISDSDDEEEEEDTVRPPVRARKRKPVDAPEDAEELNPQKKAVTAH